VKPGTYRRTSIDQTKGVGTIQVLRQLPVGDEAGLSICLQGKRFESILCLNPRTSKEAEMTTLRDVIRKKGGDIYFVSPDATIFEAMKMMADHNTGAVLVMSVGKVEGILSERDCVRRVDLHGRTAKDTSVSEIMTSKVLYGRAGQSIEECVAIMIDKNIRHLPVFENDDLIGLISSRDVLKEMVDEQKFMISQLEHYITGGGR
jgi:CBS domain-containing protein